MKQQFRRTALASLVMLMSATALVACGGGDDPAPPPAPPGGGAGSGATSFATPSSKTATAEGGALSQYAYAGNGITSSPATDIAYSSGVATMSHVLAGTPGSTSYAGVALRLLAPGNADASTGTSHFDASSKNALKIKMATTNSADTSIVVMLHPYTAAGAFDGNGCAYKKTLHLTDPTVSTEYTITLSSFTYPVKDVPNTGDNANCASSAPTISSISGNLYGIDVRNEAISVGTHDVKVEYIKFQ